MRASEPEFRYRFWILGLIFWLGFSCYRVDPMNAGVAIASWISGQPFDPHSGHGEMFLRLVFAFAAVVAAIGIGIRTWGAAYLKSEVVHDLDLHSERLLADGPFRWTRNPLYLGGLVFGAGIGVMASRLGWAVLVILIYVFYLRLIGREESELRKTQGPSYAAYCERVPRFWPALRPRVAAGGMEPRWAQAFAGESFLWACVAAVAVLAATLDQAATFAIIGVAMLIYAVYVFGYRRKGRAPARGR